MQLTLVFEHPAFLERVRRRLLAQYGPQRDAWRLDPVSQLVLAMLSARTRDAVSLAAFERLRCCYVDWNALSLAAPRDIEAMIAPVTFADRKAAQLSRALRLLRARCGNLALDFLAGWDEEAATQWLKGLPGVGAKVAAAVLNFSTLRKRSFTVDTLLLRLGTRLGLLPADCDYESGHALYARFIPDVWDADDLYEFHWLLKYHGQQTCTFATPRCDRCVLRDLCPSLRPTKASGIS